MRAYVITSGIVFFAIVAAHVARVVLEGPRPLHEPVFVVASIAAIALTCWAAVSLRARG